MNTRARSQARSIAAIAILTAVFIGGIWLSVAGVTVWLLVGAVVVLLTVAAAQHTSWTMAFASAIAVSLLLLAALVRVYPHVGLGFSECNTVLLAVLGAGSLIYLVALRDSLRLPTRAAWMTALVAGTIPMLSGLAAVLLAIVSGATKLSWAMNNDAVWNTVTARSMYLDGGLVPSLHENSAPLTAALMASSFAPGRTQLAVGDLLEHDVTRQAELWVLATILVSFLAGLVAARAIGTRRPVLRILGAAAASGFIVSWYVAGFAFQYGFYNVMPGIALLLMAWLVWTATPSSPVWGCALQFVISTAVLSTWAPLAAVPFFLGVVAFFRFGWSALRRSGVWSWIGMAVAGFQLLGYIALVSFVDLNRDGQYLTGGGAMAPVKPAILFALIGVVLCAAALGATITARSHELVGVIAVVAGATIAYGYLAWQLRGPAQMWGYYPAKVVWLMSIMLVVLLLAIALSHLGAATMGRTSRWIAVSGVFIVAVSIVGSVPPSMNRVAAVLPVADIARNLGASARDSAAQTLFELSDPTSRNMVAQYSNDPGDDYFTNGWLLQLQAESGDAPIRQYAYYLNAEVPAQVCDAIRAWGEGVPVTVNTSSVTLESELRELCADADFAVIVGASDSANRS